MRLHRKIVDQENFRLSTSQAKKKTVSALGSLGPILGKEEF